MPLDVLWNEFQITTQDSRTTVRLNGGLVGEGDGAPNLTPPGFIGFQYHTGKVQFRLSGSVGCNRSGISA